MSIILKRIGTCVLALVMLGAWAGSGAAQQPQPPVAPARSIYLPLMMEDIPGEWIGPGGGLIAALAISPSSPNIVYAGSWGGGLYKSPDGGGTWAWKSQGLLNQTVVSIAVDPTDPSIAYAGTYRGKVFKTADGGESWFLSSEGIQEQAIVYSTVIDPGNPQRIYIATRGISNNNNRPWSGVVYRSDDGGRDLEAQALQPGRLGLPGLCLFPDHPP